MGGLEKRRSTKPIPGAKENTRHSHSSLASRSKSGGSSMVENPLKRRSFDVAPEHRPEPLDYLAHGCPSLHEIDCHGHEISGRILRMLGQLIQELIDERVISARSDGVQSSKLPRLRLRIGPVNLNGGRLWRIDVLVHPDRDLLACLFALRMLLPRLRDGFWQVAFFMRTNGPAHLVDLLENSEDLSLDPVRERLDVVRPAQWIDDIRYAGLLCDDLLGTQCHLHGLLGGNRVRLVQA